MSEQQKPISITIHGTLEGYSVDVAFVGSIEQLPAVTKRLQAVGVQPMPARSGMFNRQATQKTQPEVINGQSCCPVHKVPLRLHPDYGYSCPSKAVEGQQANQHGYCGIKFIKP